MVNGLAFTHPATLEDTTFFLGLAASALDSFTEKAKLRDDSLSNFNRKKTVDWHSSLFVRSIYEYFTSCVQSDDNCLRQSSPGLPEILTISDESL